MSDFNTKVHRITQTKVRIIKGEGKRLQEERESARGIKLNMFRLLARELFPDTDIDEIISSFKSRRMVYNNR